MNQFEEDFESENTQPNQVTGPFIWDQESLTILIITYESTPTLYMSNHPEYKLKNKRADAINNIRNVLFDSGYDVSCEEITKKIHNLRTTFFKEYAKTKKSYVSGAGTSSQYIPKLWYYEMLKFLIHSNFVRASRSNILENPSTSEAGTSHDKRERQEYSPPNNSASFDEVMLYEGPIEDIEKGVYVAKTNPPKKAKNSSSGTKKSLDKEATNLIKTASNVLTNISNKRDKEEDDLKAFGRVITEELRKISDENELRSAKRQILNCALDAQERAADKKKK